ncbi:MAG: hypothetical protein BWY29_00864 [Microgenomates group bacterium ADurb.Bin238]|nr:MAG: hypothetical protein BWY29_00864 [Microgenomates group bacterium ADurb.Bin238]
MKILLSELILVKEIPQRLSGLDLRLKQVAKILSNRKKGAFSLRS